jgi:deazaflavin-dependent oxidoreductase (nitroreductase family)
MSSLIAVAGFTLAGLAILGAAFVVGMRARSPLVHRPLFWFSRRFLNPRQMRTAGTPGAYASIIRAPGRRSGRVYETPVGVVELPGFVLIALPYGTAPQWVRNVRAARAATVVHEGRVLAVESPEVIPLASVADRFAGDALAMRLLRTDECLRLRIVEPAGAGVAAVAAA